MISLKEFMMNQEEPLTLNPENMVAKLSPIHLQSNVSQRQKQMYTHAYDKYLDRHTDLEHKKYLEKILEKALLKDFRKLEDWYELEEINMRRLARQ
jgi:hypothetical protein